jgi:hypothetical protein
MRSAVIRWLTRPQAVVAIAALGVLLCSPALTTGLSADDYFHSLVLTRKRDLPVLPTSPMEMFTWANGDTARAHALMELGMTGWWTDPHLVMTFLRPLSVATHWLDYRLWPNSPALMHLHSLAWFGLGLLLLGRVYARLFQPHANAALLAPLALLLFAVDDAHGFPVAWIANRNALCALVLALCVLLLHDRAAREQDQKAKRGGPIALLLALLAGESALAVTAYLFAYALFLDPRPRKTALRALLPYAGVAAVWSIVYRALGYGARGSGLVVDPGSEPLRYLARAAVRVPVMLAAEFGLLPADLWEAYPMIAPWLPRVMLLVVLLILLVFLLALLPILRTNAVARCFALGALLSALPVAAQFPSDRLLFFPGIGGAALIALLIAPLLLPAAERPSSTRVQRAVGYGCIAIHLVISPLWLPLRSRAPLDGERMLAAGDRSIGYSPSLQDQTLVLINPPLDAYAGYVPPRRVAQGLPRPRAVRWLATGASEVRVDRIDAYTLEVRPRDGFLSLPSEQMQRDPRNRMEVGHTIRFSDLTITITALTPDGRPATIRARFARPLEDPGYRFMDWRGRGFVPFDLPKPAESRTLARVDFTQLLP